MDVLRGRRWHPSQVVTDRPDGGSELRLRLSCLEEIEQHVLGWGAHATIVGPQALRDHMGRVGQDMVSKYGEDGM